MEDALIVPGVHRVSVIDERRNAISELERRL